VSLKFFVVGRERRRSQDPVPPDRDRRAPNGNGTHYIGIEDRRVSRRHAEIYVLNDRIFVRDLGSKNGTFVLEQGRVHRITEGYVRPQQIVSFGGRLERVASLLRGQVRRGGKGAGPEGAPEEEDTAP
jgi:pSer/pThr/pTyr-binding forkhead associated (FHA) protein